MSNSITESNPGDEIEDPLDDEVIDEDVVYSVNSFGSDFLVDGLIRRLESEDIFRPHFQRSFVWTLPQASRFIESILLGLPIPGIFLYREEGTRKHLIIDGLQRLTTIQSFAEGIYPNSDKVFRLSNIRSKFKDLYIKDLDEEDRRRFFDTVLHATIIQQLTPENDSSSAYYIFERLNTGGTPLEPEEIRAALYHGEFQDYLVKLNSNELWRAVFGPMHKRGKDIELLLRFFAFRYRSSSYKSPMKIFLNRFMALNRDLTKFNPSVLDKDFIVPLQFIVDKLLYAPFRPVRSLNVATFDSVMVTVSSNFERVSRRPREFRSRYERLIADADYLRLVTRNTASEQSVKERLSIAYNYLVA